MSNPTDNFSFDLDPYDRLAQMFDGGLFKLLPLPPSWANYVRAQYAPDPTLFSAPASDTPGFDKSPMFTGVGTTTPGFRPLPMAQTAGAPGFDKSPAVLEALAAANPGPAGFYRSPIFTGMGTTTPGFRPQPTPPIGDTPGFHKSPAVLEALAKADPRPPGFYRSPALLGASATAPSLDSSLTAAVSPQETLFGRPDLSPMSLPPLPPSWQGVTPVRFPTPPSPGNSSSAIQPSPATPAGSPSRDVSRVNANLPEQQNALDNESDLNIGYTPAGLRAQGGEFARIATNAAHYGQVVAQPYVNFYNNSIVKPFYAALGALAASPLGDPGFYASLQGIGPYGVSAATAGQGIAQGLRTLANFGRGARIAELEKATVPLFRAIGQNELRSFLSEGGYAAAPSQSGKYFSFDLHGPTGAVNFAVHPFNANLGPMTMTQVDVPRSLLLNGTRFFDPGGAGASIHFEDEILPLINQFGPRIIGQ